MANDWWELQILCEPEMEDLLFWRLEVFGCRGMAIESKGHLRLVRSYLPKTQGMPLGGSGTADKGEAATAPGGRLRADDKASGKPAGNVLENGGVDAIDPNRTDDKGVDRIDPNVLLDSRAQAQAQVLLEELSLAIRQDALTMELSVPEIQWRSIDEEDWASSWKQYWQPLEIGDRFLINPAWLPLPKSERLVLRLDPGVAFGTGNHATTQLCLESLSRLLSDGNNAVVADIGCGSGILAIGAVLLGASKVYAVDIDPLAVNSTASNRELNQISPEQLVVEQGSMEKLLQLVLAPVDGIVCNILAEVIIGLLPAMSAIAKSTTWGILSGILMNQSPLVTNALEQHGWFVAHIWQRQDWCCLNIRRSNKGL